MTLAEYVLMKIEVIIKARVLLIGLLNDAKRLHFNNEHHKGPLIKTN